MVILTVRFPNSQKTYDYLMENPNKIKIEKNKPLRLVVGTNTRGVCTQTITVTEGRKADSLPCYITSKIILYRDGFVRTRQLSSDVIKKLRKPFTDKRPTIMQKTTSGKIVRIQKPMSFDEFDEYMAARAYVPGCL